MNIKTAPLLGMIDAIISAFVSLFFCVIECWIIRYWPFKQNGYFYKNPFIVF